MSAMCGCCQPAVVKRLALKTCKIKFRNMHAVVGVSAQSSPSLRSRIGKYIRDEFAKCGHSCKMHCDKCLEH